MARKKASKAAVSFLVGILGASIVWLYVPYFRNRGAGQGMAALVGNPIASEAGPKALSLKEAAGRQALGSRFQMVGDGEQVFLVDLKEGRVWRYFHHPGKAGRDEEGFLPLPMFYGGKTYYSANEVEHPPPGEAEEKPPS